MTSSCSHVGRSIKTENKELSLLRTELSDLYSRTQLYHDGFCLYLYDKQSSIG
jgi:hypothetical protein